MTSIYDFDILNNNTLYLIFFYSLGFLFAITGLILILTESSVHGIIYLMLLFLYLTQLTLVFKMEFLALIFIIIYIGAVCVLMLFHIKLIKTFVHRYDNIHNKDLSLPLLFVSLLIPLLQLIALYWDRARHISKEKTSLQKTVLERFSDLKNSRDILELSKEKLNSNVKDNFLTEGILNNNIELINCVSKRIFLDYWPLNSLSNTEKPSWVEIGLLFKRDYNYKPSNIKINNVIDDWLDILDSMNIYYEAMEYTYRQKRVSFQYSDMKKFANFNTPVGTDGLESTIDAALVKEINLNNNINFNYTKWVDLFENIDNMKILGFLIYDVYFIHLIVGSFILLVAMIGSIFLTLTKERKKKNKIWQNNYLLKLIYEIFLRI